MTGCFKESNAEAASVVWLEVGDLRERERVSVMCTQETH